MASLVMNWWLLVMLHFLFIKKFIVQSAELTTQVSLSPKECICPSEGYMCQAVFVTALDWISDTIVPNSLHYSTNSEVDTDTDGVQVEGYNSILIDNVAVGLASNLTSEIFITDPLLQNGTELTCEGATNLDSDNDTLTVCITGNASLPTNVSVECSVTFAVVRFQPPVYGAECVSQYSVMAVDENQTVVCTNISDDQTHVFNCSYSRNLTTLYQLVVTPITAGIDGAVYYGESAIDCCMPHPENVSVSEVSCDINHKIAVTWNALVEDVQVIVRVRNEATGDVTYEETKTRGLRQLVLNFTESDPLEIGVIYRSHGCVKETTAKFKIEGVIIDVFYYQKSEFLTILSRDCIENIENYRVVVECVDNKSGHKLESFNVSFRTNISIDLMKQTSKNYDLCTFLVTLVEYKLDVIVDKRNVTMETTQGTNRPPTIANKKDTTDDNMDNTTLLSSVFGALAGGIVLFVVIACLIAILKKKKKNHSMSTSKDSDLRTDNMDTKTKRDTSQAVAITTADLTESLYEELDSLKTTSIKKGPEVSNFYHVLESPKLKREYFKNCSEWQCAVGWKESDTSKVNCTEDDMERSYKPQITSI